MSQKELPNINEVINGIRESATAEHKRVDERIKQKIALVEGSYLGLALLNAEGVYVKYSKWGLDCGDTYDVDVKQLPAIRRALGRLKADGKGLVERSATKIWVYLTPVDPQFKHFRFRYKAKLPTGAKCRIVKRRQSSSYRSLVCEF